MPFRIMPTGSIALPIFFFYMCPACLTLPLFSSFLLQILSDQASNGFERLVELLEGHRGVITVSHFLFKLRR